MDMFDSMLSSLSFIKSASATLVALIGYLDAMVLFVRSLLPLTISGIFTISYQVITIIIIFWFIRWVMSTIPFFGTKN